GGDRRILRLPTWETIDGVPVSRAGFLRHCGLRSAAGYACRGAEQPGAAAAVRGANLSRVAGLQLEAAEAMVGRIRANLTEFGRQLAPESTCEPNLVVAFVEDSREFLRRMERER